MTSSDRATSAGATLQEFEFDKDDHFQGPEGEYWWVSSRVYDFDAVEYDYTDQGRKYEVTEDVHRRQYVLCEAESLGYETQTINELELEMYYEEVTKDEVKEAIA